MRNISLYCIPSPCVWQKGKQIPVLNSVSARSSRWALPIGANPGLLEATPPALPASQDCIFYLSLLGFIFAEHSILGCNQPRNPPRACRLVISHRRSSEWGAHKGKKRNQKQRAPRSLLEKGQEPLIFQDSSPLERLRAGKTHMGQCVRFPENTNPFWLKGEGTEPSWGTSSLAGYGRGGGGEWLCRKLHPLIALQFELSKGTNVIKILNCFQRAESCVINCGDFKNKGG